MTRGEIEINVSLPQPESIFKHLSIVSVREVTPRLPTLCVVHKNSKARERETTSLDVNLYTDMVKQCGRGGLPQFCL